MKPLYQGRISNHGSQYVEAPIKTDATPKSTKVEGSDLRSK
jgi:hypothetical protein